jgi:30S ribosomal protein S31
MASDTTDAALTGTAACCYHARNRARCADSTHISGIDMGKGDKKTRKGKIYAGSHGNTRPHSAKSKAAVKTTAAKAAKPAARAPAKKVAAKKAAPKKSA